MSLEPLLQCFSQLTVRHGIHIQQIFDSGEIERRLDNLFGQSFDDRSEWKVHRSGYPLEQQPGILLRFASLRWIATTALDAEDSLEDKPQVDVACPSVALVQCEGDTVAAIDLREQPGIE